MSEVNKRSEIRLEVGLDKSGLPVDIQCFAVDSKQGLQQTDCKGMILSLFDRNTKDTLKIDLWTKDMEVMEMDRFVYQMVRSLADTYYRATNNADLANEMQRFAQYFGEKTEIIPPANY